MTQVNSAIRGDAATTQGRRLRHARERAAGTDQNKEVETVFDAKRLTERKFADPVVQADMKLRAFKVLSVSGEKPMIQR